FALRLYFLALAMIVSKPLRTSAAVFSPTSTPPASVLCRISGDTILRTTGKPMREASFAAAAAFVATPSFGTGMPYASQTSLPSGAVSELRPSAFAALRIFLTSVLFFAIVLPLAGCFHSRAGRNHPISRVDRRHARARRSRYRSQRRSNAATNCASDHL